MFQIEYRRVLIAEPGHVAMVSSPIMIRTPLRDTHPSMERILIDGYRAMSPIEKLQRVCAMTEAVERLALADIRRHHPEANPREQALRLASRRIEPQLMRQAFGWDVEVQGY